MSFETALQYRDVEQTPGIAVNLAFTCVSEKMKLSTDSITNTPTKKATNTSIKQILY